MNRFLLLLLLIISPLLSSAYLTTIIVALTIFLLLFMSVSYSGNKYYIDNIIYNLFYIKFIWMIFCLVFVVFDMTSVTRIIQLLGCFSAFLAAATVKWRIKDFIFINKVIALTVGIGFLYTIANQLFTSNMFVYDNPNIFAAVLMCWLTILLFYRSSLTKYVIGVLMVLLLTTSARIDFMCAILLLLSCLVFTKRREILKIIHVIFWLEVIVMSLFVMIYPMLLEYSIGVFIDEYSKEYTGKQLMSGRNQIWLLVFDYIKQSPLIGKGLSCTPATLFNINLSCHNLFLQILLQEGLLGFIILLLLLYKIEISLKKYSFSNYSIIAMCFILVMLFHECFEICLTQNLLFIGLIMWFIIGLGFNRSLRYI